jgi:hypothetical protein
MRFTKPEFDAILAGLRLLQQVLDEGSDSLAFRGFEALGIDEVLTDGETHRPLTGGSIDELCERISTPYGPQVCPYCECAMEFEGYDDNHYTDRDHTARWLCENPECRAEVAEVRHPPNPEEFRDGKPEREVILVTGARVKHLKAWVRYDDSAMMTTDFANAAEEWTRGHEFDHESEMWEEFYAQIGEALFDGWSIVDRVDRRK